MGLHRDSNQPRTIKIEVIMLYAQGKESHQHCVEINQISDWNIGEHGH